MKHNRVLLTLLTATLLVLICLPSQAAIITKDKSKSGHLSAQTKLRALAYSVPVEPRSRSAPTSTQRVPLSVSVFESSSSSPGVTIGSTWYEYQHNCSMGRMIETGPHSGGTGQTIVHMGWMHLPDSQCFIDGVGRTYMYNAYKSVDHSFAGAFRLHDYEDEYSGYVNVDVTPDNRALVGGHSDQRGPIPYQAQIHFDACPACELFDNYVRVPDSLSVWDQEIGNESCWPKFFFQFGTDTALHIAALISTDNRTQLQAMMYFRKVGYEGSPDALWDSPPYVVDSVPVIAQDITGERMGDRVCMAWFANLPYQEPSCDTCSGASPYPLDYVYPDMDNDIYYQVSNDQGATWEPRTNITKVPIGEASYKAFCDCSILFDQSGYLHIVWHGCPWPEDTCAESGGMCWQEEFDIWKARLFHWSENAPEIRTIVDHTYWYDLYEAENCWPPPFALRVAKPSISECDGKLYVIWTQFNDIPGGVVDDCAAWGESADIPRGAINGDIWVSVSSDFGVTWDGQRNLTNTYTPGCEPYEGTPCESEYWASMSRWGRQVQSGEDWTQAITIDPSAGTSPTDYYLDIQYVQDLSAGTSVHGLGGWTNNPMKWFRMPCVEPVINIVWIPEWTFYGDPNYNLPGEEKTVGLYFENAGNAAVQYTISLIQDDGPPGWLQVADFSGTVPSGLDNIEYGTVILNAGGVITSTGTFTGRLHVEGNDPVRMPADIEIELIVADTICPPTWDVVNTACLSLVVSSSGNMGHNGNNELGTLNMDYYPEDCDTANGKIYMWDGTPFVGGIIDGDTAFTWSIWNAGWLDDYGFRPQCGEIATKPCLDAEVYQSGTFTTHDSTIGMERIWVAPQADCPFIIEYMRVWSFDSQPHDDLMIGEAIDWDVPWDFLPDDEYQARSAINTGGTDGPRSLLYQRGYEAYGLGSDTGYPYNCQYNDERFAGNAFVESYLNGAPIPLAPYGGFIGENDSLPAYEFEGFEPGLFYQHAIVSGLHGSDSTEDLHTVMVFESALDLGGSDVYEAVSVLATVHQGTLSDLQAAIDAGKAWYLDGGGISMFVDDNDDGQIDACEGCCIMRGDFTHDQQFNPLDAAAFVNWMWRAGPEPECIDECDVNGDDIYSGELQVNPLDAVYLVNFFWRGGPPPVPCP